MRVLDILIENLPYKYVDLVINNIEDHDVLDEEATSILSELLVLFDWNTSREGYEFWDKVFDYLQGDSELPQLPIEINYKESTVIVAEDMMYVMNAGGTGLDIKYEIIMCELHKSTRKAQEQVLMWLN